MTGLLLEEVLFMLRSWEIGDKANKTPDGTVNIKDDKAHRQTGFGLGFYLKPTPNLDLSIAYRSPVDMKADHGKLTVDVGALSDQDNFTATLPLVDEYTVGVTYNKQSSKMVSFCRL